MIQSIHEAFAAGHAKGKRDLADKLLEYMHDKIEFEKPCIEHSIASAATVRAFETLIEYVNSEASDGSGNA
jgi:hypothetical protein